MNDLITTKIDRARTLLAEARDAESAKRVVDIARAAEVYAQRQKLSKEAIDSAHTIMVDAMALLGEFLKRMEKNPGVKMNGGSKGRKGNPAGGNKKEPPATQTLAAIGVSKRESSDSQAIAAIKSAAPDLYDKVRSGDIKLSQARVAVKREEKKAEMKAKADEAAKVVPDDDTYRIIHGDTLTELKRLRARSARLIFADPPYNIDVDYGEGTRADNLPPTEYMEWATAWLRDAKSILTDNGSLWVLIGDEYAAEYAVAIKSLGYTIRAWVKWYETFGVNCSNNFNRCSRHLFYCVVNSKRFVFHPEAVNRPSDRQTKYNDTRADPAGKIWDDVWQIPRLVGTAKERIPDFPTQLPIALLTPIVGCASDPGDLVVDAFCGSASMGATCIKLNRRFVGIEKSERFVTLGRQRLLVEARQL